MKKLVRTAITVVGMIVLLAGCTTIKQADFDGPFVGATGNGNGR